MTTLREAATQALEALEGKRYTACGWRADCDKAITALRAALAEPVQAPVAWRFKAMIGMPWSLSDDGYYISCKRDQRYFVEALYAAPPQRKPLTEGEISNIWDGHVVPVFGKNGINPIVFARAIERAHNIKE